MNCHYICKNIYIHIFTYAKLYAYITSVYLSLMYTCTCIFTNIPTDQQLPVLAGSAPCFLTTGMILQAVHGYLLTKFDPFLWYNSDIGWYWYILVHLPSMYIISLYPSQHIKSLSILMVNIDSIWMGDWYTLHVHVYWSVLLHTMLSMYNRSLD